MPKEYTLPPKPISDADMCRIVEDFCKAFSMTPTEFSRDIAKDCAFYHKLKEANQSVTLRRVGKVYNAMKGWINLETKRRKSHAFD